MSDKPKGRFEAAGRSYIKIKGCYITPDRPRDGTCGCAWRIPK